MKPAHVIAHDHRLPSLAPWMCAGSSGGRDSRLRQSELIRFRFSVSNLHFSMWAEDRCFSDHLITRCPDHPILRSLNPAELRLQKSRIYSASL
jgi:hypothetical protein